MLRHSQNASNLPNTFLRQEVSVAPMLFDCPAKKYTLVLVYTLVYIPQNHVVKYICRIGIFSMYLERTIALDKKLWYNFSYTMILVSAYKSENDANFQLGSNFWAKKSMEYFFIILIPNRLVSKNHHIHNNYPALNVKH